MQRQNLMAHGAEASKYEAKQWRQRARPNRTKVGRAARSVARASHCVIWGLFKSAKLKILSSRKASNAAFKTQQEENRFLLSSLDLVSSFLPVCQSMRTESSLPDQLPMDGHDKLFFENLCSSRTNRSQENRVLHLELPRLLARHGTASPWLACHGVGTAAC